MSCSAANNCSRAGQGLLCKIEMFLRMRIISFCFIARSQFLSSWFVVSPAVLLLIHESLQVLNRRLHTAPQKLIATTADTQAVQAAICACLASAFGTKVAYAPVADLLCTSASTAVASRDALVATLLELSCTGMAMPPDEHRLCMQALVSVIALDRQSSIVIHLLHPVPCHEGCIVDVAFCLRHHCMQWMT